MLTLKRPGDGIQASRLPELVGHVALAEIPADTQLRWDMLSPPQTRP
jgi:sialic acid synthase SpsE